LNPIDNIPMTKEMIKWQHLHQATYTKALTIAGNHILMLIHDPVVDIHVSGHIARTNTLWDESSTLLAAQHIEMILTQNGFAPGSVTNELDKMSVLDIGANIGSYSLGMAAYLRDKYPFINVFAFEPAWKNYALTIRSIELSKLSNIYLFPYGLSNAQTFGETLRFVMDATNKGHSHVDGNHSWTENDGEMIEIETASIDLFAEMFVSDNVLNSFSNSIWMKIDVEGFESFVFDGAHKFLSDVKNGAPCYIKTEFLKNKEDIFASLTGFGYSMAVHFDWKTIEQFTVKQVFPLYMQRIEAIFVRDDVKTCIAHKLEQLFR